MRLRRTRLIALSFPMEFHWEDRDSMAHGVEGRVSIPDYRLAGASLGMLEDYKLRVIAGRKTCTCAAGEEPISFLVWRMIGFGRWLQQFAARLPRKE